MKTANDTITLTCVIYKAKLRFSTGQNYETPSENQTQ